MLTTFPVVAGVTGARDALNIVFVLVVLFTLLQGPTLPAVARWTGVTRPDALREIQVETAPLDLLDADLLTVSVPPGSRLHGVTVFELRLPHPTAVTLVVRDGASLVPDRDTVLRAGDELLLITTPQVREAAERRLRAVGRRGKLARWLGQHGTPESEPLLPHAPRKASQCAISDAVNFLPSRDAPSCGRALSSPRRYGSSRRRGQAGCTRRTEPPRPSAPPTP